MTSFNKWYDSVQEPWRMLVMVSFVIFGSLVFNFVSKAAGACFFLALIANRMVYLYVKGGS
jgi:hypothetical protein